MTTTTMKIQTTGKSVVMFGSRPDGKWFERYYPTTEAAQKFAAKWGWATEVMEAKPCSM